MVSAINERVIRWAEEWGLDLIWSDLTPPTKPEPDVDRDPDWDPSLYGWELVPGVHVARVVGDWPGGSHPSSIWLNPSNGQLIY